MWLLLLDGVSHRTTKEGLKEAVRSFEGFYVAKLAPFSDGASLCSGLQSVSGTWPSRNSIPACARGPLLELGPKSGSGRLQTSPPNVQCVGCLDMQAHEHCFWWMLNNLKMLILAMNNQFKSALPLI